MAKFILTNSAVHDLTDIWDYTVENWSAKQAEKYYKMILGVCSKLAVNPRKGKTYSEIYPDLKDQKISRHIIFYREIDPERIEITRILHERMNHKGKLRK